MAVDEKMVAYKHKYSGLRQFMKDGTSAIYERQALPIWN